MAKPLHESLEELQTAVAEAKAALWDERHEFAFWAGLIWVGLALALFAFGPDWLG